MDREVTKSTVAAGGADRSRLGAWIVVAALCLCTASIDDADAQDSEPVAASEEKFEDLDLEQLSKVDVVVPALDVVVSTVSRQESTVGKSPAAVFVITGDMIRRSGARSIPEALRMAPGVQVARIDASKWAISIRGFNGRFANKLLVQIDGRSVYTPLFGGVYWDVQDVVLEDVERIEVIRGPGATVWGANAVNGVINIITKKAADTQGVLISGGGGNEERGFATVRYGGQLGADTHYRIYGKYVDRDRGFSTTGISDDWRMRRFGGRLDWQPTCCDTLTLQGDYYNGFAGQQAVIPDAMSISRTVDDDVHLVGGNVLLRWTREISDESDWALQFYYDRTERRDTVQGENRDTYDIDFQHRLPAGPCHDLIWGWGYRWSRDVFNTDPLTLDFGPGRTLDLFSAFVQDEITLREDLLYLTLGAKFENNDFTGFEVQPSIRVLWTPTPQQSVWAAVSRAVRTPSRVDHRFSNNFPISLMPPTYLRILGNPAFESEELIAYELGYREQTTDDFSWDVALFYHDYDKLTAYVPQTPISPPPVLILPQIPTNRMMGETYGVELTAAWQLTPCWRVSAAYSFLQIQLHAEAGTGAGSEDGEGKSPHNQVYFQSSWDLAHDMEFDLMVRYVDELSAISVPSYLTMDLRWGWRPCRDLEVAIVGQNLLDSHQLEFTGTDTIGTEVQRGVYGIVTWQY